MMKKIFLCVILFMLFTGLVFFTGCNLEPFHSRPIATTKNGMPDGPGPGDMKNPDDTEKEIIGITWVVYQYQGADGKVQEMDTDNPAKRITYTFDGNNVTVQWGDQITQVGTYTFYIKDQSLDNVFVHFKAAVSPDKRVEYDAADIHYHLIFESRVEGWQLELQNQETGEVFKTKATHTP